MQTNSNTEKVKKVSTVDQKSQKNTQLNLKDFMTPEFISKHSNFIDIEHLFNESNFKVECQKDIDAILNDELNQFIVHNTLFDSWDEMQKSAMALYLKK